MRRLAAIAGLGAAILGMASAPVVADAAVPASEPGDMVMGSSSAPVAIIEYASVGCPHCAAWDETVFPTVKSRLIDTKQARFVVRVMLTGDPSLATAGFMLVRCAGPAHYFEVIDAIYRKQTSIWQGTTPPVDALEAVGGTVGMGPAKVKACLTSKTRLDEVNALNRRHADEDKVELTPTFFVGDKRFEGDVSVDTLAGAVSAARGGG